VSLAFSYLGCRVSHAVVVIARDDDARPLAPVDLYAAMQRSPLAAAIAEGAFDRDDPFPRPREMSREPSLGTTQAGGADGSMECPDG